MICYEQETYDRMDRHYRWSTWILQILGELTMTIKIEDGIDDLTAISLVKQVIEQGKISNNGNSYCYLTMFGDMCVETRLYRKSPCFRVYKNVLW